MLQAQMIEVGKKELIHYLLFKYCQVVDDGDLNEWPDLFTDHGSYYVYAKDNYEKGLPIAYVMDNHKGKIKDRVTLINKIWTYNISYQRHMITNIMVESDGNDKFICYANFSVYRTNREGKTELFAVGRYKDLIVFEGNTPRFEKKEVILDTCTLPSYFVRPL